MREFSPELFGNGPWNNTTTVHPIGLLMVIALGLALLLLPRRHAVVPMLIMACFVAPAQRIVILGADFDFLRILVLFGWLRLAMRRETEGFRWMAMDKVILCWAASAVVLNTLSQGSVDALVNRLGYAFDALGMYFLFRCLIRGWDDLNYTIQAFAVISVPVAIAFLIESQTGRNAFSIFGGVPEITMVRNDRLRCQGAFSHPILAGCFWASVLPLMAAQWWQGAARRTLAGVGCVMAVVIILCCASSTPVSAVCIAAAGACFYFLRHQMRTVRWALAGTLLLLHFVMNQPVWHLLARVDFVGGSTGYHRYWLINKAIENFGDWWLCGTAHAESWDPGAPYIDITNHYVLEGVRGGLLTLALLIALISLAFRSAGYLGAAVERQRDKSVLAWALGVAMLVHTTNYLAISYFGQIIMVWYLHLAMVTSLYAAVVPARQPVRPRAATAGRPMVAAPVSPGRRGPHVAPGVTS